MVPKCNRFRCFEYCSPDFLQRITSMLFKCHNIIMNHTSLHLQYSECNLIHQPSSRHRRNLFQKSQSPTKSRSTHQSPTIFLAPVRPPKRSLHSCSAQPMTVQFPKLKVRLRGQEQATSPANVQSQGKRLNRKLLNLLYLQNIQNVNPYIETLHELSNNPKSYDPHEVNRVRELCYIGLGKNLVVEKKVSVPPYSRVNLLIREFMIDVITEEIKDLQRRYPDRIYIQCNDRALGYNTRIVNEQVCKYVSQKQVQQVIYETNKIIEREFISFKQKKQIEISSEVKASFWISLLGIALLVVYVELYKNKVLMALAWTLILLSVMLNVVSLIIREKGLQQNLNIIDQIQKKLLQFLDSVNQKSSNHKWKCGKDFYWLEIAPWSS